MPFTHGGLATEVAGGALFDLLKNAWMKTHQWTSGSMNNANAIQALLHLLAAAASSTAQTQVTPANPIRGPSPIGQPPR
jgi:hypothetical protein